jgi:hypothetical protein
MSVSATATRTDTDTYTDARLRAVMVEVGADFYAPAAAGLITYERACKWTEELSYILQHRTARSFQIQCTKPDGSKAALHYVVSSDGSVRQSGNAGGIDFFGLPKGSWLSLFVDIDWQSSNSAIVRDYITQRGWGMDGQAVQGDLARDRVYSKDGYGVIRSKIGQWP